MTDTKLTDPFAEDSEVADILATFKPTPVSRPRVLEAKTAVKTAAEQGFTTRQKIKKPKMRRSRFYETGRSEHIAMKGRAEDKARIDAMRDRQDWVAGQLLQYALDALEEKLADPESQFWAERSFQGVD